MNSHRDTERQKKEKEDRELILLKMNKIKSNPEYSSNNSSNFDFKPKLIEYSINASSFSSSQLSFCSSPLKKRLERSRMLSVNSVSSIGSNNRTDKLFPNHKKSYIVENEHEDLEDE